jgi:hypothetical protein
VFKFRARLLDVLDVRLGEPGLRQTGPHRNGARCTRGVKFRACRLLDVLDGFEKRLDVGALARVVPVGLDVTHVLALQLAVGTDEQASEGLRALSRAQGAEAAAGRGKVAATLAPYVNAIIASVGCAEGRQLPPLTLENIGGLLTPATWRAPSCGAATTPPAGFVVEIWQLYETTRLRSRSAGRSHTLSFRSSRRTRR